MLRRTRLKRSTKPIKRSRIVRRPPDPDKAKARKAQRKEHQKQDPYSVYWRDLATTVWSKIIRKRANGVCEYTGKHVGYEALEAHHIVPCGIYQCRTDLFNGLAISAHDHQRSAIAPHGGNQRIFQNWLRIERPDKYEYWKENKTLSAYTRMDWQARYRRLKSILEIER